MQAFVEAKSHLEDCAQFKAEVDGIGILLSDN